MVHTAQLIKILSLDEIKNIEKKFNIDIMQLEVDLNTKFKGITATFNLKRKFYMLDLKVDFIQLLSKSNIGDSDYKQVEDKLTEFFTYVFGKDVDYTLIRIDYRYDVKLDDPSRKVLLKILPKSFDKFAFKKKYDQYGSSLYYNSKSCQLCIYDKEQERMDKNEVLNEFEEGILRYEIRILNKHLNYIKNKYGISKELKNYFSSDMFKLYFSKHMLPIIFTGDYYKIYVAEKIINESSLSEKDKKFLREFLVDVSKNGITSVKEKYTKHKFNKAKKLLNELNINPILIPKNEKVSNHIKNPLSMLLT